MSRQTVALPAWLRWVLAVLGLVASMASAQTVQISVMNAQPIELDPADFVTLTFHLDHLGTAAKTYDESLDLPEGWSALLPFETLDVLPATTTQRSMMITLPKSAPADLYELTYRLSSAEEAITHSLMVAVLPQQRLHILPIQTIDTAVMVDETETAILRVVNEGNVQTDIQIRHQLSMPGRVVIEPNQLSLPAQSYQDIKVSVTPQTQATQPTMATFRLHLETAERQSVQHWRQRFEVIPRVSGADPFLRYPIKVGTRLEKRRDWTQLWTFSGSGYVDEQQLNHVSFLTQLKWPAADSENTPLERFWVRYQHRDLSLHWGDQVFGLSTLTLPLRRARGGGVDLAWGVRRHWQAGFLSYTQATSNAAATAGYLAWSPSAAWTVRLNRASQTNPRLRQQSSDTLPTHLWSVEARFKRAQQWHAEVAASQPTVGAEPGYAGRLNGTIPLNLNRGPSRLRLQGLLAQPKYAGAYSNVLDTRVATDWTLSPGLRSLWSYRYLNRNLAKDPARGLLLTEQLWSTSWHWTLTSAWRLQLGYRFHLTQDAAQRAETQTQVSSIGLSYRQGPWSWQSRLQQATSQPLEQHSQRLSGFLGTHYRWSQSGSVRAQLRWSQKTMHHQPELLDERRDLLLQADWRPQANWTYRFVFRDGVAQRSEARDQFQRSWSLGSHYQWDDQRALSLQLNHQERALHRAETTVVINYEWLISPAIRYRQSVGGLYGQVLMHDGDDYRPAPHALVRVHHQVARTDVNGHYEIRSLPPQEHPVRVQLSEAVQAAQVASPHRVATVIPGQRTHWPIVLATPGQVVGRINVKDSTSDIVPRAVFGPVDLSGIQWVLEQEETSHWMQANARGEFQANGLAPGQWQVRVVASSLPRGMILQPASKTITVQSGQSLEIAFDGIQQKPLFEWIDTGETHFSLD